MSVLKNILHGLSVILVIPGCQSAKQHVAINSALITSNRNRPEPSWYNELISGTKSSQVVQLGESIHLTQEMPLVRIGALKQLNQQNNFDILAVEGSAVDSWLAMDVLLQKGPGTENIKAAQRRAFFGLWQTPQMREVIKTVADSLTTNNPIYMTSFDSQVGMAYGWQKNQITESLADAFIQYGIQDSRTKIISALLPIQKLRHCFQKSYPNSEQQTLETSESIDQLESWISKMSAQVEKKSIPHAKALKLLPYNLRNNLSLCKTKKLADPKKPWRIYQETRDKQNSENVISIVEKVSKNKKIVTWAHHSHVHYNSSQLKIPSMGQYLKQKLGSKIYSVGVFALRGEALIGQEEPELQTLKWHPDVELQPIFQSISHSDFFIDLRTINKGEKRFESFFRPATIQIENNIEKITLGLDYDGVIVLQKISAPQLEF